MTTGTRQPGPGEYPHNQQYGQPPYQPYPLAPPHGYQQGWVGPQYGGPLRKPAGRRDRASTTSSPAVPGS